MILKFMPFKNQFFIWNLKNVINKKAPLYLAVEKGYIEIVKLLINNNKLDINYINILYEKLIKFMLKY